MIKEACRNYFHLIRHPFEENKTPRQKILTAIAILSCIIVPIPLAVGAVYGIARRIQRKEQDPQIEHFASKAGIIPSQDEKEDEFISDNTPQMIEALGGREKVEEIPFIENWSGHINDKVKQELKAPIMRGVSQEGLPIFIFTLLKRTEKGYTITYECIERRNNGWLVQNPKTSELKNSEQIMLDKIRRLVAGEAVGLIDRRSGMTFPENPPNKDTTDLFLCDPQLSLEENIAALKKQFPATTLPEPVQDPEAIEKQREAEKMIAELSPQMVEALGGIDNVLKIPIYENWNGTFGRIQGDEPVPPASITRYYNSLREPILVFYYLKKEPHGWETYVDCIVKKQHGWEGPKPAWSELGGTVISQSIFGNPVSNEDQQIVLMNRLGRLMRGEAVGLLKELEDPNVLPEDAFLQGEDWVSFAALDLLYYEKKPREGATGLFLYDPTKTKEENLQQLHVKFPGPVRVRTYVDELLSLSNAGEIEKWRELFLREVAVISDRVEKPLQFDLGDVRKFSDLLKHYRDQGLTLKLWFDKNGYNRSLVPAEIARYNGPQSDKECVWGIIELFSDTKNAELIPNTTSSGIPVVSAGVLPDDQGNWVFQDGTNPDDFFEENRYVSMFPDLKRANPDLQKNLLAILRSNRTEEEKISEFALNHGLPVDLVANWSPIDPIFHGFEIAADFLRNNWKEVRVDFFETKNIIVITKGNKRLILLPAIEIGANVDLSSGNRELLQEVNNVAILVATEDPSSSFTSCGGKVAFPLHFNYGPPQSPEYPLFSNVTPKNLDQLLEKLEIHFESVF